MKKQLIAPSPTDTSVIVEEKINCRFIEDQRESLQNDYDCGFIALGIGRQEVMQYVQDKIDQLEIRQLLLPEIRTSVMLEYTNYLKGEGNNLNILTPKLASKIVERCQAYQAVDAQVQEIINKCNDLLGFMEGNRLNTEQLTQYFAQHELAPKAAKEQFMIAQKIVDGVQKSLDELLLSKEVCLNYINNYYGNSGLLAFQPATIGNENSSLLDIIAMIKNCQIVVWQPMDVGNEHLRAIYKTKNHKLNTPQVHIKFAKFHNIDGGHFTALLPVENFSAEVGQQATMLAAIEQVIAEANMPRAQNESLQIAAEYVPFAEIQRDDLLQVFTATKQNLAAKHNIELNKLHNSLASAKAKLLEIDTKLADNPQKLVAELTGKKSDLTAKIAKLTLEKNALDDTIAVKQNILIENLAKNADSLSFDEINLEYVLIAIDQFNNHKYLEPLQKDCEAMAKKRKDALSLLTINAKINHQQAQKNKLNEDLKKFVAQKEEAKQKLTAANTAHDNAVAKLTLAQRAIDEAQVAKTKAQDKVATLKEALKSAQHKLIDYNTNDEKQRSVLNARLISDPQKIDQELASELARMDLNCNAYIQQNNNSINSFNSQKEALNARKSAIERQLDKYKRDIWLHIHFFRLQDFINLNKELKDIPAKIQSLDQGVVNLNNLLNNIKSQNSADKDNGKKLFADKKSKVIAEINKELSALKASYDDTVDGLKLKVVQAEDMVKVAAQALHDADANYHNAVVEKTYCEKSLGVAKEKCTECTEKLQKSINMIDDYSKLLGHVNKEIDKLFNLRQSANSANVNLAPLKKNIDLMALNKELEQLKNQRAKLAHDVDVLEIILDDIKRQVDSNGQITAEQRAQLTKERTNVATECEQLASELAVIAQKANEFLAADLLSQNVVACGFNSKNLSVEQSVLACLLQEVDEDYILYDLNGQANIELLPELLPNITAILNRAANIKLEGDVVTKLVVALNQEFARDNLALQVTVINNDGLQISTAEIIGARRCVLWQQPNNQYVLLTCADKAIATIYERLHKIAFSAGLTATGQNLCSDVLENYFKTELSNVPVASLSQYYLEQEESLKQITSFAELSTNILKFNPELNSYESSLAASSLKLAAVLDNGAAERNLVELRDLVAERYLDDLRKVINQEIQKRNAQDIHSQEDRLQNLEYLLEKNDKEIQEAEKAITQQEARIRQLEAALKEKEQKLELMGQKYAEQQQEINAQLAQVEKQKNKCAQNLAKIETNVNAKQQEINALQKVNQKLEANKQALEAELKIVEQEWEAIKTEVAELKKSLNIEQANLKKINTEQADAKVKHERANAELERLKIFMDFIRKIHESLKEDRGLFAQRKTLRNKISQLRNESALSTADKGKKLCVYLLSLPEINKIVNKEEKAQITQQLKAFNDVEMLSQLYGVILELIGVPNITWERAERKYLVTGYNLSWQEVSQEIENVVKENLANCGLGFVDRKLVVNNLTYFGRISDLPDEIRKLINQRIEICRNQLSWEKDKVAYGQEAQPIIADLEIDYHDVLKAYVDYIEVIAGNNLEADSNINLPGISLSLYAKGSIFCKENLQINTSGKNAMEYKIYQAPSGSDVANGNAPDGRPGMDGLDGIPGQSAGHIFIQAEKDIINLKTIKCIANGGQGAHGQRGGDGEQGRKGKGTPDANATDTTGIGRAQWRLAKARIPGIGQNNEDIPDEISGNGGPAGKGGWGGPGGYAGEIQIADGHDNKITKLEQAPFANSGAIGATINFSQLQAQAGNGVAEPAPRGQGGKPGEAGEVGLDNLVIKESFWVSTRYLKGYYDESVFKDFENKLNLGWGHDIFGVRAFIDEWCNDYRVQYRLYGECLNPPCLGNQRQNSTNPRSRGQQGEADAQNTKDISCRQKAVTNTNYPQSSMYFSNMCQNAINLSQNKEWQACKQRCKKYIAINEQNKLSAQARLDNCIKEKTKAQATIQNVTNNLNRSVAQEKTLSSKRNTIKTNLKETNKQLNVANQKQLTLLQEMSALQVNAIEARAVLACANIDVDSKQDVSTKLDQIFNQINATCKISQNVDAQQIQAEQELHSQMSLQLENLRNEQIRLRNQYQQLLLEQYNKGKKSQYALLEKHRNKSQRKEQIQVESMLAHDNVAAKSLKYIHEKQETIAKSEIKKVKESRYNKLIKFLAGANDVAPAVIEPIASVVEDYLEIDVKQQSLDLTAQYLKFITQKHFLSESSREYSDLSNSIKKAMDGIDEYVQQTEYCQQLLQINDFKEITYVLDNTTGNPDRVDAIVLAQVHKLLVDTKIVTKDSAQNLYVIKAQVAQMTAKALLNKTKEGFFACVCSFSNAIKAFEKLPQGDSLGIEDFIQEQASNLLIDYAKAIFNEDKDKNENSFALNIQELTKAVLMVYDENQLAEIVNAVINLIPPSSLDAQELLASLVKLKELNVKPYEVYASVCYKLIDIDKLSVRKIVSLVDLVFVNDFTAKKQAMQKALSQRMKLYSNFIQDLDSIAPMIIFNEDLAALEKQISSLDLLAAICKESTMEQIQANLTKFKAQIVNDNLAEFSVQANIKDNIWVEFLSKLTTNEKLHDLIPQYLFNFACLIKTSPDKVTLDLCRQLEQQLTNLKKLTLNVGGRKKHLLTKLANTLESILESKYLEDINQIFENKFNKLEEFDIALKTLDQKAKNFESFYNSADPQVYENKQIFVKLLLAKLIAYNITTKVDNIDQLVLAVKNAGLEYLQKTNIFAVSPNKDMTEEFKKLHDSIMQKDVREILRYWFNVCDKVKFAFGNPNENPWLKQFLLDSNILFKHLLIDEQKNSANINNSASSFKKFAFNWEDKDIDHQLRDALDQTFLTLELAAYKHCGYYNVPQSWQRFIKENLIVEHKKALHDLHAHTMRQSVDCFNRVKLYCEEDALMHTVVEKLKIAVKSEQQTEIDKLFSEHLQQLQQLHENDHEDNAVLHAMKCIQKSMYLPSERGKIELLFKKILLNLKNNHDLIPKLSVKVVNFLNISDDFSNVARQYLYLIAQDLVNYYQNQILACLDKLNNENLKSFLLQTAAICLGNESYKLLLNLYYDLATALNKPENNADLVMVQKTFDECVNKVIFASGSAISLGGRLLNDLALIHAKFKTHIPMDWLALVPLASKEHLSSADVSLLCSKIANYKIEQVDPHQFEAYAQLINILLQRQCRNLELQYGAGSHNGQSIMRIAKYGEYLAQQITSLEGNLAIKQNFVILQQITSFLVEKAANKIPDNHLLQDFLQVREILHGRALTQQELCCLLTDKEADYVNYVSQDILVQKASLPNLWQDLLKNTFFNAMNKVYLNNLFKYTDQTTAEYKTIKQIFSHGAWDHIANNRELTNLMNKLNELYNANIGDLAVTRKFCEDALAIINTAMNAKKYSAEQIVELKTLQAMLVHALNFKELLISSYVDASANNNRRFWLECVEAVARQVSNGLRLMDANQILAAINENFDSCNVYDLLNNSKTDKVTHKFLIARLHSMIKKSSYAKAEQDKLLIQIKAFEGYAYNSELGRSFINLLAENLMIAEDKSVNDVQNVLNTVLELKIHQQEKLLEDLSKQNFHFWNTILKRHKWQCALSEIGVKGNYPKLVDNLIALEKCHGSELVVKIFNQLKANNGEKININGFCLLINKFVTRKWMLGNAAVEVMAQHPFNNWLPELEKYFNANMSNADISIEQLIQQMRDDKTGVNNSIAGNLDAIKDKVNLIKEFYIKEYHYEEKDKEFALVEKKLKILECVEECRKRGSNFYKSDDPKDQQLVIELLAAMCGALKVLIGHPLRDAQILAILGFISGFGTGKGKLANIFTGEGKSYVTSLLAVTRAIFKEKVDIITSSRDLAERDAKESEELLALFGIKVSNNCDNECMDNDQLKTKRYHDCEVIYGDIGSFQRDYLLSTYMQKGIREKIGDNLIVDEVDSMCIDNAETTLYISHRIEDLANLKHLFTLIWEMVNASDTKEYTEQSVEKIIQLVNKESKKADGAVKNPIVLNEFINQRLKTWIENAYCAKGLERGRDYTIPQKGKNAGKPVIMDLYTGVEQINTQWSNGLHQFIQLKHKCALSDESLKAIFISNMNYLRKYADRIYGMSGTLGAETELDLLAKIYGLDFFKLPRHKQEHYIQEEGLIAKNEEEWLQEIANDVHKKLALTREISLTEKAESAKKLAQSEVQIAQDKALLATKEEANTKSIDHKSVLEQEIAKLTAKLQDEYLQADSRQELLDAKNNKQAALEEIDKKLKVLDYEIKELKTNIAKVEEDITSCNDILLANTKRAILIIVEDQNSVKDVYNALQNYLNKYPELGGYNLRTHDSLFDEFEVGTLHPGDVVVATNIAGRGTDFKTSEALEKNGGLHVILGYMPSNIRVEIQAFGRTARKGNEGSGKFIVQDERFNYHPISIEFLREERDAQEAQRLAEFRVKKQARIDLEDELFKKFAELQNVIKDKLKHKLLDEELVALQIKSLQNHWAFWLDKFSQKIENVYKDGPQVMEQEYQDFSKQMLAMLENGKFNLIHEPGELLKLGKYYFARKDYSTAESCYDEIIKQDPEFAAFAHYYKTLCMFGNESGYHRKEEARAHLKKAVKLFEDEIARLSSSSQIIKVIAHYQQKVGEGTEVDYFTASNSNEIAFLNTHLQAALDVLGSNLNPESFASGRFFPEDSKKIFENIRKKRQDLIKDYRLSKKANFKDGELYYKDKKVVFPEQLQAYKKAILDKLATKKGNRKARILELEFFDQFILKKDDFLQDVSADFAEQALIEVVATYKHTVMETWLGKSDLKEYVLSLKKPVSEESLAKKFSLTKEELQKILNNLEEQNIIKRSLRFAPIGKLAEKLEQLDEEEIKQANFFKDLAVNLPQERRVHAALYETTINQACISYIAKEDFKLNLPENVEEKRKAYWAQFKDLSVVKYPSVKFSLTHNPEKALDKIKDSLKNSIHELFKSIDDKEEREKMEESIYDTLEKAIGKIKAIPKLKIDERNLQFYFKEGKMPPEIMDYMIRCCDEVLSLKKDAGWWDWGAFVVAMIGIVQLAAGVIITGLTCGAAAFIGQVLISEGISDVMFAAQSMAQGSFNWKAYGDNKWQSLLISIASAGVGAALAGGLPAASVAGNFSDAALKAALAKKLASKLLETAITCGVTIAAGALSKEIAKMIFAELKKTLKKEIRNSPAFKVSEKKLKEKMAALYKILPKSDVNRMISVAMNEMNLEQKIASQFTSHAMKLGDKIAGQLGKLGASDKFAALDQKTGSNLKNPTIAVLAKIGEALSNVLLIADVFKVMVEISTHTATLIDEFEKKLEQLKQRTKNSKNFSANLSSEEIERLANENFDKLADNITSQLQVYFEKHLLSGGIVKLVDLARKPTLNVLVEKLAEDFNKMETSLVYEGKLKDKAGGKVEISAKDEKILVGALNGLKVSEVLSPNEMAEKGVTQKVITSQGERDIKDVIKLEGNDGAYIIHRNDKYYLIQPDFLQSLQNLEAGRYSNATDLRYFAHNAHRPIQVVDAKGNMHHNAPLNGFSDQSNLQNKPIKLVLENNHFRPFIQDKPVEIPQTDPNMPANSCAAQAIVFVTEYDKALAHGASEQEALGIAMEYASNQAHVREYIHQTVEHVRTDTAMRDLYYSGFKDKFANICGGEAAIFSDNPEAMDNFAQRLNSTNAKIAEYWDKWHMTNRLVSGLQCFGGVSQVAAGFGGGLATLPSGLGAVAGALSLTIGVDNAIAGCPGMFTGETQATLLLQGLLGTTRYFDLSDNFAIYGEMALGFGFSPEILALSHKAFMNSRFSELTFRKPVTFSLKPGQLNAGVPMDKVRSPIRIYDGFLEDSTRRAFRRDAERILRENPDHELRFLLNEELKFHRTYGLSHELLLDNPELVQMGHIISNKAGGREYLMIQGAWENQFNRITIEKPYSGVFVENPAIYIGRIPETRIPVSLKTAMEWEYLGKLPKGTVERALEVKIRPML